MKVHEIVVALALAWALGGWTGSAAWAAPGEDPLVISGPVSFLSLPGAKPQPSGQLQGNLELPAWMKAKMSRYTAKAFSASADDGSIYTDSDVINTAQTTGFQTTCVQEVGSVSGDAALGTRYGPGQRDQVVVLRGDLVNICK